MSAVATSIAPPAQFKWLSSDVGAQWDFSSRTITKTSPDFRETEMSLVNNTFGGWMSRRNEQETVGSELYNFSDWGMGGDTTNMTTDGDWWVRTASQTANTEIRKNTPDLALSPAKRYQLTFEIQDYVSGGVAFRDVDWYYQNPFQANGVFTVILQAVAGSMAATNFRVLLNTIFVGKFRILSIKEYSNTALFQITSTARPILRTDSNNNNYAELDLVDDVVMGYLPTIVDGTILIATSKGIWVTDFNWTEGMWNFGYSTYDSGPANLFQTLKDSDDKLHVYGIFYIDRELTANEKNYLVNYYKSRCGTEVILP